MENQFNIPPYGLNKMPEPAVTGGESQKPHGSLWLLLVIILLVAAGGAAAWGYPDYWGLRGPAPEVVFTEAIGNMAQVNSSRSEGEFNLTLSSPELSAPATIALGWTGAAEGQEPLESKAQFDLALRVKELPPEVALMVPGGEINLNLLARKLGPEIYFQLTGLPTNPFFDVNLIANRWVKIDLNQYQEYLGQAVAGETEQLTEFQTLIKEHQPFDVVAVGAYHYELRLNKTKLRDFIIALTQSSLFAGVPIGPAELPTQAELDELLADLDPRVLPKIEVWIDEEQKLISRILATGSWQAKPPTAPQEFTLEYSFEQKQFGWNEPIQVELPTESVPIEQLMQELGFSGKLTPLESEMSDSSAISQNASASDPAEARIKSIMSSLRAEAEIYYEGTIGYGKLCSNSVIKQKLAEVESLHQPASGSDTAVTNCKVASNGQSFVITSRLVVGDYFCVDSDGQAKEYEGELPANLNKCP